MYVLFTYCTYTVHVLKNIKNGSHSTIYIFKNYFATVFSVFSFNNNKLNPNRPILGKNLKKLGCVYRREYLLVYIIYINLRSSQVDYVYCAGDIAFSRLSIFF